MPQHLNSRPAGLSRPPGASRGSSAGSPSLSHGSLGRITPLLQGDPRISHTYDVTSFDNEELRPGLPPGDGTATRGAQPTSKGGRGSGAKRTTNSTGGGQSALNAPPLPHKDQGQEGMFLCRPVGDAAARPPPPIPSKVQRALEASAGVYPANEANEEVEIDSLVLLGEAAALPAPTTEKKKGGLLLGLGRRPRAPKSAKGTKTVESGFKSLRKKSMPLGRLGKSSNHGGGVSGGATINLQKKEVAAAPPLPSPAQVQEAKKWRATCDKSSDKTYYYHRVTKEVRWEKPPGYDEAHRDGGSEKAGKAKENKSSGMAGKEKENKGTASKEEEHKSVGCGNVVPSMLLNSKGSGGAAPAPGGTGAAKEGAVVEPSATAGLAETHTAQAAEVSKQSMGSVNMGGNDVKQEHPKHWRTTFDAATGKTYYYNKKTKEVRVMSKDTKST